MERKDLELREYNILCVTNRKLCREFVGENLTACESVNFKRQASDCTNSAEKERTSEQIFLDRINCIAANHPAGIILREKDLPEAEYELLAGQVMEICARHDVRCILHSFADAALRLHAEAFHAPLPVLRGMPEVQRKQFHVLGASCHSVEDALEAEQLGCTYITAGHIFDTNCKKGLPGRGLGFLQEVCATVNLPVWAIGGITPDNAADVRHAGAAGVCVMSGLMQCEDVAAVMRALPMSVFHL